MCRHNKPPSAKKHRGMIPTLLGLTLTAANPLVKTWLSHRVKHWLAGQAPAARLTTSLSPTSKFF